jgi:hypothetical protein
MENGHIADKMVTAKRVIETREIDQFQAEHQALVQDLIEQKAAAKKEGDRKLELEVTDRLIKMHDINGKGSGVYREKVEHSGNVESMMSDEEVERRAREILERRSNK